MVYVLYTSSRNNIHSVYRCNPFDFASRSHKHEFPQSYHALKLVACDEPVDVMREYELTSHVQCTNQTNDSKLHDNNKYYYV